MKKGGFSCETKLFRSIHHRPPIQKKNSRLLLFLSIFPSFHPPPPTTTPTTNNKKNKKQPQQKIKIKNNKNHQVIQSDLSGMVKWLF